MKQELSYSIDIYNHLCRTVFLSDKSWLTFWARNRYKQENKRLWKAILIVVTLNSGIDIINDFCK